MPAEYRAIFARFAGSLDGEGDDAATGDNADGDTGKGHVYYSDDEALSDDEEDQAATATLSKRKLKKMNRLTVAELKRLVKRADVVDWFDVSALDPRLLVHLKSYRNTIAVPPHWKSKRDYLAGKKGIEKAQFQLPSRPTEQFIPSYTH